MYHGCKRHPVRHAQLGEHAPEVGVHGMQRDVLARLAAVSTVPWLAWSSSERANREDKEASRPGCSMDDNYRPQTCICQSVWRLGAKRTSLPLLNCSQHEAFTVARTVQKRCSAGPGWPYAYLSFIRHSYSAIGGEEPPFPPSRTVICTACRLTCDIRRLAPQRKHRGAIGCADIRGDMRWAVDAGP